MTLTPARDGGGDDDGDDDGDDADDAARGDGAAGFLARSEGEDSEHEETYALTER